MPKNRGINMAEIRKYRGGSKELLSRFDEIYALLMDVYEATGGRYPALEWVYSKPLPGEKGWKDRFGEIYRPFLRWRLENELDEIFTVEDEGIIGIIGLNYDISEKEIFEEYHRLFARMSIELEENAAFLEILAVHPSKWREGIGRVLLKTAMEHLERMGKKGYGITFPNLYPAISLYDSVGASILGTVRDFVWNEGDKPADYLLVRFTS